MRTLLIGPWAHLLPYASQTSRGSDDIDFGNDVLASRVQLTLVAGTIYYVLIDGYDAEEIGAGTLLVDLVP